MNKREEFHEEVISLKNIYPKGFIQQVHSLLNVYKHAYIDPQTPANRPCDNSVL